MRLASTANAAEKRPNMVYSYVRNRKHVVFTAYWKVSSAAISKRQIAAKACSENLADLESRLDNIVYRAVYLPSEARQLVSTVISPLTAKSDNPFVQVRPGMRLQFRNQPHKVF